MRGDRGVALLEAVTALALLGVAGTGLAAALREASLVVDVVQAREQTNLAAGRVLTAASLLKRDELDARTGPRQVGEFIVTVRPVDQRLFRIGISLASAPDLELLATLTFPTDSRGGRACGRELP